MSVLKRKSPSTKRVEKSGPRRDLQTEENCRRSDLFHERKSEADTLCVRVWRLTKGCETRGLKRAVEGIVLILLEMAL